MKFSYIVAGLSALYGAEAATESTITCSACPPPSSMNDIVTRSAVTTPSCSGASFTIISSQPGTSSTAVAPTGTSTATGTGTWLVTTKGGTWVMAKLVGNDTASVTFDDIANTIDGGANSTLEQKAAALHSCDTNGGQVGVEVNTMDHRYQQRQFKD
ncbi:hypothetical protein V8C43DRAFT_302739 [Trichoderma afarasin]